METGPDDATGEQPSPGPVALSVRRLSVRYRRFVGALQDIDLDVAQDGIIAVLGGNGAGKSTLLRAVSGTLRLHRGGITAGTISLDGNRIDRLDAAEIVARAISSPSWTSARLALHPPVRSTWPRWTRQPQGVSPTSSRCSSPRTPLTTRRPTSSSSGCTGSRPSRAGPGAGSSPRPASSERRPHASR